ncbi:integrase core domain-containing protein [Streptomyces sp. NPDC059611]|uniref:integrase core domain-containing protein n=1 Tax=Streptomyces sp. NPDC059611 TaxID=3346884 RepID=UPI0036A64D3A
MEGRHQVERAIVQWITWYNGERLHSALDYVPPAEYERACWRSKEQTPQSAWTKTTGLYESRGSSGCAAGVSGQGRRANQARCQWRPAESVSPTPP